MDVFWVPLLAILVLFHQTSMCERSGERGGTMIKAPAGESDTMVVIGAVGKSVSFHINSRDGKAALLSYENDPIVTVSFKNPVAVTFHKDEYKTRFNVSEDGRTLTILQLRMEDAGTYSAKINGKTYTFILLVFRELEVPMVTCETQNSSDGSSSLRCSVPGTDFGNISYTWRVGDQLLAEGPVVLVNESHLDMQKPLMCTVRNPVSSRNISITNLGALCADAHSGNSVWIPLIVMGIGVPLFIVLIFLAFRYKSKVPCMKERLRGRDGRRGDSHGAAGDMDTEAEVFV